MGASSSTQSNKSIEDIFAAETMFFNKAGSDDIAELLKNIGEFADMHDPLSKGDLSQGPTQTGAARDWQQMQYGITEIDQCNS